jgi:hypothetical protein
VLTSTAGLGGGGSTSYFALVADTLSFVSLLKSTDNLFQVGSLDQFGRRQILNAKPLSILRLGYNTSDGDPFNAPSEGIVVNAAPTVARIKGDRIGLTAASNTSNYWFRADNSEFFFRNFGGDDMLYAKKSSSFTAVGTRIKLGDEKFRVAGSAVFDSTVTASTFNAVGSAYMMNGVIVIDRNTNIISQSSVNASGFFGMSFNSTGSITSLSSVTASGFFGDGSGLTGISGGSGDMINAATESISGAKIWLSSSAAGPLIYTTTATTGPGAVTAVGSSFINTWMVVASTKSYGASDIAFSGLTPNKEYKLLITWNQDTSGTGMLVTFNNDGGFNYKYSNLGSNSGNGSPILYSSNSNDNCSILSNVAPGNYDGARLVFDFSTNPLDDTKVFTNSTYMTYRSGSNIVENTAGACYYAGSSALSTIRLSVGSGTFTGTTRLLQLIEAE